MGERPQLIGRDMQCRSRFRGKETGAPVCAGKVDRLRQKGRFVERDVEFKRRAARETGFGKQQVAATRPAADRKIGRTGADIRGIEQFSYCIGRDRLLARWKPRLLAPWRVDHMAAEQQYIARRAGLIAEIQIRRLSTAACCIQEIIDDKLSE